jgi:conjugal transfer pilin signal peptidase TrbI
MTPRLIVTVLMTFLSIGVLTDRVQLLINTSSSLPNRYFLHLPKIKPVKGDITTYEHQSGQRLIKKIMGVEGDVISYDVHGFVWVGTTKIGKPHPSNRRGDILHAISPGMIPKDHVFLYTPHDESLDSRYADVGLVYIKHLHGKAIGIV